MVSSNSGELTMYFATAQRLIDRASRIMEALKQGIGKAEHLGGENAPC